MDKKEVDRIFKLYIPSRTHDHSKRSNQVESEKNKKAIIEYYKANQAKFEGIGITSLKTVILKQAKEDIKLKRIPPVYGE